MAGTRSYLARQGRDGFRASPNYNVIPSGPNRWQRSGSM